jgi:hypothetical protein
MANVNRHRYSMSGLDVVEEWKWGRDTADKRYGPLQNRDGAAPPSGKLQKPQAPEDRHAPGYDNDAKGWVRAAGERAENKPGYLPGHKGK